MRTVSLVRTRSSTSFDANASRMCSGDFDIPAGKGSHGRNFEPIAERVLTLNYRSGILTVDRRGGKDNWSIKLRGQPEFPATSTMAFDRARYSRRSVYLIAATWTKRQTGQRASEPFAIVWWCCPS